MVSANGFLFTAGATPLDPLTGSVVQGDVARQTRQVLDNLRTLLDSQGLTMSDVVKITAYLTDLERDFAAFDAAYSAYFDQELPARTTVGCGLRGVLVEMDMVVATK
jgi:2-iminobutanoate/2-iminopropanoate deaminase